MSSTVGDDAPGVWSTPAICARRPAGGVLCTGPVGAESLGPLPRPGDHFGRAGSGRLLVLSHHRRHR